ncbi:DUF2206 domain-containing protein [Thermococcus sp.]|uniref:DUF2206 domain-containing protein n=1 Tax=Thermococcus sp. TaxID=35749 RepID=UPI002630E64C|nr:DUF2206 domain-containing protein [Thermococcus sp.]
MDRKSLIITISILLGLNSSILLDYSGIHIPLARQVFGFVALTFLPGYLVLKIFNTQPDSLSEQITFQIALSISVAMFMGIFMNFVYPFLGIRKPITLLPVLLTFDIVILGLLLVEQFKGVPPSQHIRNQIKVTKVDLFFVFLPIISLLSAYLFSHYRDNRGLLILYFIIALTPLVFIKSKNFNRTFAIWSIAISLMWSTDFGISWNYIWGYDINGEYYYSNLVLSHGIWDVSVYSQYNAVASYNILAPLYSLVLNIWIVLVFKIVYPFLFSTVPVVLLKAYEKILNSKTSAVFSVLFFMFFVQFFVNNMALARMMIVEIYLAFLVYSSVKKIHPLYQILFLMSLAVSHYGTAYLVMFSFLVLFILRPLFKNDSAWRVGNNVAIGFIVVTLLWYSYVGGGFQFKNLVMGGYNTLLMLKDLFNPHYSQGLELIVAKMTLMREIAKWINLLAQGFILIGILTMFFRLLSKTYETICCIEFYVLSLIFFIYDLMGIAVPYFSNRMNTTRLYHLTQFFIAPYLTIGFESVLKTIKIPNARLKDSLKICGVFLVIYFIFTSGLALIIAKDPKPPLWLEKVDGPYWNNIELSGGKWLVTHRYDNLKIYSDQYNALLFLGLAGQPILRFSFRSTSNMSIANFPTHKAYVYLGSITVNRKMMLVRNQAIKKMEYVSLFQANIFEQFIKSQRVYSSKDVWIYLVN